MLDMLDETVHEASRVNDVGAIAFTPRQLEVLEMISAGLTNAEIAQRMELSVHGIKFHLAAIYRQLGVATRTEAAVTYLRSVSGGLDNGTTGD